MSSPENQSFYSHGKLLISSEYIILDGATGLAVPTQKGQHFKVVSTVGTQRRIYWKSYTTDNTLWFDCVFDSGFHILATNRLDIAETLQKWLLAAANLNPEWLIEAGEIEVTTRLEFPQNWGLGSSSTVLSSIARWAQVDAFELLTQSFSGSGYDLACATANTPILYSLQQKRAQTEPIDWKPSFSSEIFFVHLEKKQKSEKEVFRYTDLAFNRAEEVRWFTEHTQQLFSLQSLTDFEFWMKEHENRLSKIIEKPKVSEQFPDFDGGLKSLGAWGGDFILATGKNAPHYFKARGYNTLISYADMVLESAQ